MIAKHIAKQVRSRPIPVADGKKTKAEAMLTGILISPEINQKRINRAGDQLRIWIWKRSDLPPMTLTQEKWCCRTVPSL